MDEEIKYVKCIVETKTQILIKFTMNQKLNKQTKYNTQEQGWK